MKKISSILASVAIGLTGCVSPTEQNRFDFEVAQNICNIETLAKERQTSLSTSNGYRLSLASHQNKLGRYDEETHTEISSKLNRYDAEIEASYRFVTQQCGAYMRCLERNDHDEWACKRSEARWAESQERFAAVSIEIRDIAADIARYEIWSQSRRKRQQRYRDSHEGCCSTINSVFTDCCG